MKEIREYLRQLSGRAFVFTDYVLRGVNRNTFDSSDELVARLRVVPNLAGGHDSVLLTLDDEFGFAEDFLVVVKDTTGVFEVTGDSSAATETFCDAKPSVNWKKGELI